MTEHNCDLCGGSERLSVPGDPSGRISICGGCGFVYVPLRRSSAEVAAAWNDIYASGHYNPDWPGVKARLYYVAEWIEQNIGWPGKDMLDIGAGQGQFIRFLFRYCPNTIYGLEPAYDQPEGTGGLVKWTKAPIETAEVGGKFDIITILWTLENTADCLAMLRFARERLKPDGHVVVATGSRILVPFKKPLSAYLPQDRDYPHDTHCFRWSAGSLAQALRVSGLGVYKFNDYRDRDEMICLAGNAGWRFSIEMDDPRAMQEHFRNWSLLFP